MSKISITSPSISTGIVSIPVLENRLNLLFQFPESRVPTVIGFSYQCNMYLNVYQTDIIASSKDG